MTLFCAKCSGEGSIYASRYGGNDPDTYRIGPCEDCGGTGKAICEARGCREEAVAFNDDGEAMCEDCLFQWNVDEYGEGDDDESDF